MYVSYYSSFEDHDAQLNFILPLQLSKPLTKRSNERCDRYARAVDLHTRMFFVLPQNRPSLPKLPTGQLGSAARLRNGDYIRPAVKCNRFTERGLC